jgi:hypothetical protein
VALAVVAAWLGFASSGAAAEPVSLTVEGAVEAIPGRSSSASDEAVAAAMVEAVVEVARRILRGAGPREDVELREALAPLAPSLVLGYRIEPGAGLRPLRGDPSRSEYAVRVNATVDAAQVRVELKRLGWLRDAGGRPSVLLRVRNVERRWAGGEDPRLEPLERAVREELRANGYPVVDPGALPGADPEARSALELARAAGAAVAVEISVRLKEAKATSRVPGVVAEVRTLALRAADGTELVRMRLDTPAYHSDPAEATMRALDAVRGPVARNLRVQLEQNWTALAEERAAVQLVLRGVTRFAQVEAVWTLLRETLGLKGAELRALSPAIAEFVLSDAPAPAVLESRLTRADLGPFRLEALSVAPDRLELMVREL